MTSSHRKELNEKRPLHTNLATLLKTQNIKNGIEKKAEQLNYYRAVGTWLRCLQKIIIIILCLCLALQIKHPIAHHKGGDLGERPSLAAKHENNQLE